MKTSQGNVIALDYQGVSIGFTEAGWFNATMAAGAFGKRPADWLALDSAKDYIECLTEIFNCEKSSLLKTKPGRHQGGTWMHPKLAVAFARWLDVRFAVWCDLQIDGLLRGTHKVYDWHRERSAAAASFKVMADVLRLARQDQGKATARHHYANEAKLVNWAMTGEFKGLDREVLAPQQLALLASLEDRNAVLLARGVEREDRKKMLEQHALDWRVEHQQVIGRAA